MLTKLSLRQNRLTGSIPAELGQCVELKDLMLYENRLDGPIPVELGNCTKLKRLYLHKNQLSGSIPPAVFADCSMLWKLRLASNALIGPVNHLLVTLPLVLSGSK
jgi:Leucine-rich repeat (LRR) protein